MNAAGAERAVAALAASQHSAFGRHQAALSGMSSKVVAARLRSGVLCEPLPGVLAFTSAPNTWKQRLIIPTLTAPGGVFAACRAAAELHELDGAAWRALELNVLAS